MGFTEWRNHLMKVFRKMKINNPKAKLGDAMVEAKKTYNKPSQNGGKQKVRRRSRRLRNTNRRRSKSRRRIRKSSRRSSRR